MLSITGGSNVGNVVLSARINTAPALADLEKFKKAAQGLGAGFDSILHAGNVKGFQKFEDSLTRMASRLGTTRAEAIRAADGFQSLQRRGYTMQALFGTLAGTVGDLGGSVLSLVGVLGAASSSLVAVGGSFAALISGMVVGKMAMSGVGKAVQQLSTGQNNYNRQLYDSVKAFKDLRFAAEEAALGEEDAALKLEQARLNLAKVQDLPPSNMVRREAELAYKRAELNLREAKSKTVDLQKQISYGIKKVPNSANPFYGLTKSQIAFAKYLVSIKGTFKGLNEAAASGFLPKLQTGINSFIKEALPTLEDGFREVGSALGDATTSFGNFFKSTDNLSNLKSYFTTSGDVIRLFGEAADSAFGGVFAVLKAAEPLTKKFAGWIATSAENFEKWAKKGLKNGSLESFFKLAGDVAGKLGTIFSTVFGGINNIIKAAFPGNDATKGAGGVMLKWLQGIADGFKKFTGDKKFAKWLEDATTNGTYAISTLGDFLKIFLDLAGSPDTKQFWVEIREAIPFVKKILEDGQKAGPALGRVLTSFTRLIAAFSDNKAIQAFLDTLNAIISALADFFSNPIVKTILDWLGGFHGAILAITLALGVFKKAAMIMLGYGFKMANAFKGVGRTVGYASGMFKTFSATTRAFKGNMALFSQVGAVGTKLSRGMNVFSRYKAAATAAAASVAKTRYLAAKQDILPKAQAAYGRGEISKREFLQARARVDDLRKSYLKADAAQKNFFRNRMAKAVGRNLFFQALSNNLKSAFTSQIPNIKSEFGKIGKVLASPFRAMKTSITSAMSKAIDGAKNFRNTWTTALRSVGKTMSSFGTTMAKPFAAMSSAIKSAQRMAAGKLARGFGYNEGAKGRLGAAGNAVRGFANVVGGRLGNIGQQAGFANKFNALMKSMAMGAKNASIQYRLSWARANGLVGTSFNQLRTTMQNFERKGIRKNPMFNRQLGLGWAGIADTMKKRWTTALTGIRESFKKTATYANIATKAMAGKSGLAGFKNIFSGRSQNLKQVFGGVLDSKSFTAKIASAKAGFKGLFQTFKQASSEAGRQYRMSIGKSIGMSQDQLNNLRARMMNFSGKGIAKNFNKELGLGFRASMTQAWKAFSSDIKGTSAYKLLSGKAQAIAGGVKGAAGIISGRSTQIKQAGFNPVQQFKTISNAFSLANRSMSENYRLSWAKSLGYTQTQLKDLKAAMGNFTRKGIKNNPAFNQALGLKPGVFMQMRAGFKIIQTAGVRAGVAIKTAFTNLGASFKRVITNLKTSIPNALRIAREAAIKTARSIKTSFVNALTVAGSKIKTMAINTGTGFKAIGTSVANIGKSIGSSFKAAGGSVRDAAIQSRMQWAKSIGYTSTQLKNLKNQMKGMSTIGIMTSGATNAGLNAGGQGYMGRAAGMMGTNTRLGAGALAAGIGASSIIGALNNSEGKSGLGVASDTIKGIGMASMLAGPQIGIPVMLATSVVGGIMDMVDGNIKKEQEKKKKIEIAKAEVTIFERTNAKSEIAALIAQGLNTKEAVAQRGKLQGYNKTLASDVFAKTQATGLGDKATKSGDVVDSFRAQLSMSSPALAKLFSKSDAESVAKTNTIIKDALAYAGTTGALNVTGNNVNLTPKQIEDAAAAAVPAVIASFESGGFKKIKEEYAGFQGQADFKKGDKALYNTNAAQVVTNNIEALQGKIDKQKEIVKENSDTFWMDAGDWINTFTLGMADSGSGGKADYMRSQAAKANSAIKVLQGKIDGLKGSLTVKNGIQDASIIPTTKNGMNGAVVTDMKPSADKMVVSLETIAQNTKGFTNRDVVVNIIGGANMSPAELKKAIADALKAQLGGTD